MPDEWDIDDEEMDATLEAWEAVDRAAADYLAERIPGLLDAVSDEDAAWLDTLAETLFPEDPDDAEIESASAVMALQHADWLGLAMGVVHRGAGGELDPEVVQADIVGLEEVEGEIEDLEGHFEVLDMALLHLAPQWEDLGVLDSRERLTERGTWGLPRALHRAWSKA